MIRSLPGGRFTATNVTLRDLLEAAYPLPPSSSLGAPAWLNFDRFDVIAKAPGNVDDKIRAAVKGDGAKEKVGVPQSTDPSIEQLMLRALLQERFKLVLHEETREQPVYALTLARPSGSLGPKLARSTVDCRLAVGGKTEKACGLKVGPGALGLKLESGRGPAAVLVIDHVERPSLD